MTKPILITGSQLILYLNFWLYPQFVQQSNIQHSKLFPTLFYSNQHIYAYYLSWRSTIITTIVNCMRAHSSVTFFFLIARAYHSRTTLKVLPTPLVYQETNCYFMLQSIFPWKSIIDSLMRALTSLVSTSGFLTLSHNLFTSSIHFEIFSEMQQ